MRSTWGQRWGVEPLPGEKRRGATRPKRGQESKRAKGEKEMVQLTLADAPTARGGPRKGAGRPRSLRQNVRHVARPLHLPTRPVQITLRREKLLPSFRAERVHLMIQRCVREMQARAGFRVTNYSVQTNHIHLIVEAESDALLLSGIRSFSIRVARRFNRDVLRRKTGAVWGDRYHRRDLGSPTEVRWSLVYVLANGVKHGVMKSGEIDPCSSGRWFEGWVTPLPPPEEPSPVEPPATWLLEKGWSTVFPGFIFPSEVPAAARRDPAAARRD